MISYPKVRVCAAHAAPVFLDLERSVQKACDLIEEAARGGAELIVFPESFLPGFPVWAALQAPILNHEFFKRLAASSVFVPGPEVQALCRAARRHGVFVSIGLSEATTASVGCLWNANLLIGDDGSILNHHRKLVPTYYEKLIWANGDGVGLRVSDTRIGRLGMLICGENTNPLARYSLIAQGEQIHISSYPPIWPTRPPEDQGRYDIEQAIRIRAGAHAFEAKVFNVVASAFADRTLIDAIAELGPDVARIVEETPRGVSLVMDPSGEVVGDTLQNDEGLLYQDIDTAQSVEAKQFHDVVGYYNRFDLFRVQLDASPRPPLDIVGANGERRYPFDPADQEGLDDA